MTSQPTQHSTRFERMKINGMDVLLLPRPGLGLVAAVARVRRGSVDEGEREHGLADFTMSMLMRGSIHRSSERMAFDLESIGALAGSSGGMDGGALSVGVAASEAPQTLDILFEALREPAFDEREHEIHRRDVLAELRMVEDDSFQMAYRRYLKAMFEGHGYGHPTEGEPDDVQSITPDNCRRWYADTVHPETILLVAAGELDPADWRRRLESLTAGWEVGTTIRSRRMNEPPPVQSPLVELTKPEILQGFIVVGFRAPTINDPDHPALRLASAALGEGFGGRLFTNLRDKRSLAYAVGSGLRTYRLAGQQILFIGTKPETVDEARDGLLEEAEYLRNNLLTDEELHRARQYVIGKYWMSRQSLAQRVERLAWWEDIGGDAALDVRTPELLEAVTAEQILEAVRRWWVKPTITILRPQGKE